MQQRFATGDGNNRCPAFIGRIDTFFHAQLFVKDIIRVG